MQPVYGIKCLDAGLGSVRDVLIDAPTFWLWDPWVAPVILGSGEHLLEGLDLEALGYRVTQHAPGAAATHLMLERA
mgnify:CR=1 FL=1